MKQGALLEVLETVLVVTVITALIWLYAEGETINTQTRTITIRLVAPMAGQAVSVPEHETSETGEVELEVEATIQASRGNWQRIEELIRREIEVKVSSPNSSTSQVQPINLREALNQSALTDVNAFVKEVEPANVSVRVQQLQNVPMGIRIERGNIEISDDGEPKSDPATVMVTMPAEIAQKVRDQDIELIVHLDQLPPDKLLEDEQQSPSVVLRLPPELVGVPFVTLGQDRVNVTFIVRKQTEEIVLSRVQVRLRLSDEITGLYKIKIDPDTQRYLGVTLRGPSNTIQSIRDDESQSLVQASILIKLADLTSEDNHTAPLEWVLPDGVEIISTDPADINTITYTPTELVEQP